MPLMPARFSLGSLVAVGHRALRVLGLERAPASGENDPQAIEAMRRAEAARVTGGLEEARTLFRYVVQRWPAHVGALHALRDLAVEAREWDEAIAIQEDLLALAPSRERHAEAEWLAVGYYELGPPELARGEATAAVGHRSEEGRVGKGRRSRGWPCH